MSVVVAIKENDKVYIGSDSQATRGGSRTTLRNPNNYKVWQVKGVDNCVMGHVGNMRDANIVRCMDDLVTDYVVFKDYVDYEFVVKSIVPDIVSELQKYKYLKKDDYISSMDSSFIFAYKDRLYMINSDCCVIEIDDYVAIGSGESEALGSLVSTIGEDPESRIIKAIKASAAGDIYVDYPIIMTNTETTEFEIINEKDESKFLKKKAK